MANMGARHNRSAGGRGSCTWAAKFPTPPGQTSTARRLQKSSRNIRAKPIAATRGEGCPTGRSEHKRRTDRRIDKPLREPMQIVTAIKLAGALDDPAADGKPNHDEDWHDETEGTQEHCGAGATEEMEAGFPLPKVLGRFCRAHCWGEIFCHSSQRLTAVLLAKLAVWGRNREPPVLIVAVSGRVSQHAPLTSLRACGPGRLFIACHGRVSRAKVEKAGVPAARLTQP